jgi:hypothetical protein
MAPPVDVVGPRPRLGDVEAPPRSRLSLSSMAEVESEPLGWARRRPSAEARAESEPWVGRSGVRRLPGLSPSPSTWVGQSGVRRLPGLSPSPRPGSGGAEFAVFRGLARVRALGRAEQSGVRRLPGLSPSPSPGSGEAELPMVPVARPDCLSASLCQVALQSERRRRRCLSVRPVSGAAK